MEKRKLLMIGTAAALIISFIIGAVIYKKWKAEDQAETVAVLSDLLVREHSPQLGPVTARVTLVEFLDPECETCRQFHTFVKDILKRYDGQIRYVVRYAPFHLNSHLAIAILESARLQDKYWETLDILFEKQPEWADHQNPDPNKIWTYLEALNLNIVKIKQDMKHEKIKKIVDLDVEDGIKLDVRATPTFFVNGTPLENFGLDSLIKAIENELK